MSGSETGFLARDNLPELFTLLARQGYELLGPQVQDEAIQYLPIHSPDQLPKGITEDQQPGSYHLNQGDSELNFSWANGPQALKPWLFAPREVIWQADKQADGSLKFREPELPDRKLAVIGVRSCDLAALKLQDQHFLNNSYHDPYYAARRKGLFLVAVNCSHPAATCFCASTGDGPHTDSGFDLALTELEQGFLVSYDSEQGERIYRSLPLSRASEDHLHQQLQQQLSASKQQRALPPIAIKDLLAERRDHPRWDDIAERCLACGNCTQVCPTCFCHKEGDLASLDATTSEHLREWDSCFSEGHGYMAGHQARPEIKDRYQQWMIHKLSSWHDQYGRSGCTGCGRCTTWCPAAIDFPLEVNQLCGEKE